MDQMPIFINQNITVVSIFNLKDKRNHSVCRKRLYEIVPSKFEILSRFGPVPLQKVLVKVDLECFAQLVPRVGVGHHFDNTT